jgi:hypothetical protein
MKKKALSWRYTKEIPNIHIEDSKGNIIVGKRQVLKFGRIVLQSSKIDLLGQITHKLILKWK